MMNTEMTIPLTQGKFAIVDRVDYALLSTFKWQAARDQNRWYAVRTECKGGRRTIRMHRLVMGNPQGVVDHINGNGLDNRRQNLRITTVAENNRNHQKWRRAGSKYIGVHWHKKCRKWRARIHVGGTARFRSLGLFDSEQAAAVAYQTAAEQLWGVFAPRQTIS